MNTATPLNTIPLNNNCLIEVILQDEDVSRDDTNESMKTGILRDFGVSRYHLTASAAIEFNSQFIESTIKYLKNLAGKTVRWEEYAEGGQTFRDNSKTYALVAWWRLISYENSNN